MGFYAGRTHSIIPNEDCLIGSDINAGILAEIKAFMVENNIEPYNEESHTGLVRHVLIRVGFTTGQIMVCLVINGKKLPAKDELVKRLNNLEFSDDRKIASIMLNFNTEKTNVILGRECDLLSGNPYIEDYIGDVKYRIQPLSFYQVNPVQTKVLYGLALEYAGLTGNETVWDLYCGIGTISLFLAQNAKKVYGVEIVPEAIEDARVNASINKITNAEFYVGKAEEVLPRMYEEENVHAEVIVVDPPRKGCDEKLLDTMVQMSPERIVYVSCDSATLARDLKYLVERGYEIKKVQGVDQFCDTGHVETVVQLTRK
jgi:23S rRNA (uracil1939-C5)-methyltransferase